VEGHGEEPQGESSTGLLKAHAVFMSLAWVIFASSGIFVSRFLKNYFPIYWFRIHIGLLACTCLSTSFGFLMILIFLKFDFVLSEPHHGLGYFTLFGLIIQPILGYLADKNFQPTRIQVPIYPDRIHWYFGLTLWIVALINISLGLQMVPDWGIWPWIFYFILIAFLIAIFAFTSKPEDDKHNKEKKDILLEQELDLE